MISVLDLLNSKAKCFIYLFLFNTFGFSHSLSQSKVLIDKLQNKESVIDNFAGAEQIHLNQNVLVGKPQNKENIIDNFAGTEQIHYAPNMGKYMQSDSLNKPANQVGDITKDDSLKQNVKALDLSDTRMNYYPKALDLSETRMKYYPNDKSSSVTNSEGSLGNDAQAKLLSNYDSNKPTSVNNKKITSSLPQYKPSFELKKTTALPKKASPVIETQDQHLPLPPNKDQSQLPVIQSDTEKQIGSSVKDVTPASVQKNVKDEIEMQMPESPSDMVIPNKSYKKPVEGNDGFITDTKEGSLTEKKKTEHAEKISELTKSLNAPDIYSGEDMGLKKDPGYKNYEPNLVIPGYEAVKNDVSPNYPINELPKEELPPQGVFPNKDPLLYDDANSHFFAYFVTLMVMAVLFYLLFHNKQRIIALMIEGRRGRPSRRMSSRAKYHKLDNNLEEAMSSTRGAGGEGSLGSIY